MPLSSNFLKKIFVKDLANTFREVSCLLSVSTRTVEPSETGFEVSSVKEIQKHSCFCLFLSLLYFLSFFLFRNIFHFFSRAGALPFCLSDYPLHYLYSSPRILAERRASWQQIDLRVRVILSVSARLEWSSLSRALGHSGS